MPEIGLSGLMSGDGKRGVGHRPQATAPILELYRVVGLVGVPSNQFPRALDIARTL